MHVDRYPLCNRSFQFSRSLFVGPQELRRSERHKIFFSRSSVAWEQGRFMRIPKQERSRFPDNSRLRNMVSAFNGIGFFKSWNFLEAMKQVIKQNFYLFINFYYFLMLLLNYRVPTIIFEILRLLV